MLNIQTLYNNKRYVTQTQPAHQTHQSQHLLPHLRPKSLRKNHTHPLLTPLDLFLVHRNQLHPRQQKSQFSKTLQRITQQIPQYQKR